MPGKCRFQLSWCDNPEYKLWLKPGSTLRNATCSLCRREFSIEGSGIAQVKSHAKSKSHYQFLKYALGKQQPLIKGCFQFQQSSSQDASSSSSVSASTSSETSHKTTSINDGQILLSSSKEHRDAVTRSEIIYALKLIDSHSSARSSDKSGDLFKSMFPDSEIAKSFSLSKDKASYVINFGLGEFYREEALTTLSQCQYYVCQFDESLNKVSQRGQMDLHIRYIDESSLVSTKYITSAFLGHASAHNMLDSLKSCLPDMHQNFEKVLQLSMDGPAVNWKLHDLVQDELSDTPYKLLQIGSCGMHVIHGAFKTAFQKSGWDIEKFMRSCYYIFKDSPARRADYTEICGSTKFPSKFVGIRWLENLAVSNKLIEILPNLEMYASAIKSKKVKTTSSKSIHCMLDAMDNSDLVKARLEFLSSLANELEPFLREFQGNHPLAPFLYEQLQAVLRNLLKRIVKSRVLDDIKSGNDLLNLDLNKSSNLLSVKEVQIGFGARRALHSNGKQSEKTFIDFRVDARKIIICIVDKIKERSPLKYPLTKAISALDPGVIWTNPSVSKKRFTSLCNRLIDAGRLTASSADSISCVWSSLVSSADFQEKAKAYLRYPTASESSKKEENRLDVFYKVSIGDKPLYSNLYGIIKMVLVLSHGNAEVERGFSVNKNLLQENMTEKTLVSQRLIHQAIRKKNNFLEIEITQKMINSVRLASQRRVNYLQLLKKHASEEKKEKEILKRKHDQMRDLEEKKKKLCADKDAALQLIDQQLNELKK